MKLSMFFIEDWMRGKICMSKIDKGECRIEHCMLSSSDDTTGAEDCLYIGRAAVHSDFDDSKNTVICRNGSDYIVIISDDEIGIYQQIIDAFLFYNHWADMLKDAVIAHDTFQHIVEIANIAFRVDGITAFDWRGMSLGGIPKDINAPVSPSVFSKIQSGEVCRKIANNAIPAGFITLSEASFVLGMNVFFHDNSFVIIYFWSMHKLGKLHLQLALYMRSILCNLKPSNGEDSESSALYSEFVRILDGAKPDDTVLKDILVFKSWESYSNFSLYALSSHSDFTLKIKSINYMLADRLPEAISFDYHGTPIVILPTELEHKMRPEIDTIIKYMDYSCGASLPFSDWADLPAAYEQSIISRNIGGDEPGHLYLCADHVGDYLLSELKQNCTKLNIVSPDALLLKEYDIANNSELLKTLYVYLKNQSNMTASAEELFIHLNSMKYRVKRIETLIGTDLRDFKTRMSLLFSCAVLLDENLS